MEGKEELIWKSAQEQLEALEEKRKTRDIKKYGRDGKILVAKGKFVYRGVAYLIEVLRYFNLDDGFTSMGRDRVSDSHAVVEYPEETKPLVDLIPTDLGSEFLWYDTLHSHNDKQSISEQIEECHEWAKRDIDNLFNGEIAKRIDEGIKELQKVKRKLNQGIKKHSLKENKE